MSTHVRSSFLFQYIAFLVLIFAGEFAGGITAAVFKGKVSCNWLKQTLNIHPIRGQSYKTTSNFLILA